MQAKAWQNTLALTLYNVNWALLRARQTIGDTLSNVEAYALADLKAHTLEEAKAETLKPDTSDV